MIRNLSPATHGKNDVLRYEISGKAIFFGNIIKGFFESEFILQKRNPYSISLR